VHCFCSWLLHSGLWVLVGFFSLRSLLVAQVLKSADLKDIQKYTECLNTLKMSVTVVIPRLRSDKFEVE
jgi:hypothetical protein